MLQATIKNVAKALRVVVSIATCEKAYHASTMSPRKCAQDLLHLRITMFDHLPRPLLIAHRGASLAAPENTLEAFELAVRLGADVIELDVQLSRDGAVVVMHDATLERTTDGRGSVAEHDLVQLQALDAGYSYRSSHGDTRFRNRGVHVPTLDEVLHAFPSASYILELKGPEPSLVEAVLRVISGVDPSRLVLAAADDQVMGALESSGTRFPLGLARFQAARVVRDATLGRNIDPHLVGRALQIPPRYRLLPLASRRVVRGAHAAGLEVHVWTINDARRAERYLQRGVDGIITDDAPGLFQLVHRYRVADATRRED